MEIVINVSDVLPRIAMVAGIISNKNVMPILDNLYFKAYSNGNIEVMGSNAETWITSRIAATSINLDGKENVSFCIESSLLLQALNNLSQKQLSLVFDESQKILTCGYAEGVFKMPYLLADEYPMPVDVEGDVINVNANALAYGIQKTRNTVANDTLRPQMNGIHFDFNVDRMTCVSTDGHRLALYRDAETHFDGNTDMTLPLSALQVVLKIAANQDEDNVELTISPINAKFTFDDGCMVVTRKIEGKYPNYEAVLPKQWEDEAYLIKQETIDGLRHVMPMSNISTSLVILDFSNAKNQTFNVSTEDIDYSRSAQEEVKCVEYKGNTFKIGFNGNYLMQALSSFDGTQVKLLMSGATKGVLMIPADDDMDFSYLLMPTLVS